MTAETETKPPEGVDSSWCDRAAVQRTAAVARHSKAAILQAEYNLRAKSIALGSILAFSQSPELVRYGNCQ